MAVLKTAQSRDNYIAYSSDDKPTLNNGCNLTNGMTLTEVDTGKVWVWFGNTWEEDLRLIYAVKQGTAV